MALRWTTRVKLVAFGLSTGAVLSAALLLLYASFRDDGAIPAPGKGTRIVHVAPNFLPEFVPDPDLGYRLKPSHSGYRDRKAGLPNRTNSLGILGEEELDRRPPARNVLFLGDSVAFGAGVPYERIFISIMKEGAAPRYRLFNGACWGWTTYQELLYYEKYLRDSPVDAIVVVFCLNDLLRHELDLSPSTGGLEMSKELYEFVNGIGDHARLGLIRARFALERGTAPLAELDGNFLAAWDPSYWDRYEKEILGPLPSDREQLPVIFAAVPLKAQLEALRRGAPREEVWYPQERLARFCRERKIPFVDAAPFVPVGADPAPYYLDLIHLSEEGHAAMARTLLPRLLPLLDGGSPRTAR